MNTNTVNPEGPTTEQSDSRPEPPFGWSPERLALRRPFEGRMLAGVAAGVARYFDVDEVIVRIAFVVLTVVGGAGIPLYLAGLLLIPDEGSEVSIAGSLIESLQSRSR
jgi:phage shock protein PspC (stress-responsive transcriptional regulator)